MGKDEKLIAKLLNKPKDFTFNELRRLLKKMGYVEDSRGKTSGSRVAFFNPLTKKIISLLKPHPGNTLRSYVIN
jgi:hypothetical protein